jgi:hypothetical protein
LAAAIAASFAAFFASSNALFAASNVGARWALVTASSAALAASEDNFISVSNIVFVFGGILNPLLSTALAAFCCILDANDAEAVASAAAVAAASATT